VGPTRADEFVADALCVPCDAVEVLPRLVELLGQRPKAPIPDELRAPSDGLVGFS